MADFSSFFPEAGGGGGASGATSRIINGVTYGNIIAKPTDPGFLITQADYNNTQLGEYSTAQTSWLTVNNADPMNYFVTVNPANTYFTIANITGASNGGFLYNIISCYTTTTNVQSIKITLDGTAYTFTRTMPSYRRLCAGSFGVNSDNSSVSEFGLQASGPTGDEIAAGQPVKFFPYARYSTGSVASQINMPKIFFNSSCKVEVTTNIIGNNAQSRYAFCSIETL